jgi:hypothetical protein
MKYDAREFDLGGRSFNPARVGLDYWVCDYRFRSASDKPIRVVEPTHVMLIHDKLSSRPEVYFAPFSSVQSGVVLFNKKIKLQDNTAWGNNYLNIFDNEDECWAFYKKQHVEALALLDQYLVDEAARVNYLRQRSIDIINH